MTYKLAPNLAMAVRFSKMMAFASAQLISPTTAAVDRKDE
jgi:hypothetical protein